MIISDFIFDKFHAFYTKINNLLKLISRQERISGIITIFSSSFFLYQNGDWHYNTPWSY